ncbi:MAG TPA: DMT family transporter [Gemmatimonadales bacterium]|nr:DMT family transporter [Gemmatimonadales bacterium]
MTATTRARLELIGAAVLFSTGGAAIKWANFTGWQIASFRSGIAALALLLLAPAARRGWSWRTALVGVAYAGCLVLFVLANRLTTAANTIFLQSTAPLYILLLAPWLLKEPIRRQDLGFMLAVGLGLLLFFVGTEHPGATAPDPDRGNLLALASGFCWALAICGFRWLSAAPGRGSPLAAVVSGNLTAFLITLPMALPVGRHPVGDWTVIVYLGVFQIALAYVFVTAAIQVLPALESSVFLLIEPVLNPLWAWVIQRETPGAWALLGGAIILGATTLKGWTEGRGRVAAPVT